MSQESRMRLKNYINYHDVEIVVFKSINVGEISLYDGVKWVRQGNETISIVKKDT